MDGTLVDTEPYWFAAEQAIAEAHGGAWTSEQGLALVGSDLLDAARVMQRDMPLPLDPEQVVDLLLDGVVARVEQEVPLRPGALELVEDLRRAGVPCALVTMSYERLVVPVLTALPPGAFRVVVTGDQVTRGKPDPEPYLSAARLLGVDPADCLAIEDSDTGCRSAAAAGCTVLAVPHHVRIPPGERRVFRDTLVGLRAGDLAGYLAGDGGASAT